MSKVEARVFSFEEADHLTRIHLKLALEDVGFSVEEEAATLGIIAEGPGGVPHDGERVDVGERAGTEIRFPPPRR